MHNKCLFMGWASSDLYVLRDKRKATDNKILTESIVWKLKIICISTFNAVYYT